jgi:hypothetical protein
MKVSSQLYALAALPQGINPWIPSPNEAMKGKSMLLMGTELRLSSIEPVRASQFTD